MSGFGVMKGGGGESPLSDGTSQYAKAESQAGEGYKWRHS